MFWGFMVFVICQFVINYFILKRFDLHSKRISALNEAVILLHEQMIIAFKERRK